MTSEKKNIQVREAVPNEAQLIADFNIAMARETENVKLPPERVVPGVHAVFDDPSKGTYFVAEIDGEVVGVLLITYEWSDWRNEMYLWIQSVYVSPQHRRKGVFRSLYRHVERLAGEEGSCGLRLYAHAHNERAVATYRDLGMFHYGYHVFETPDVLR